MRVPFFGAPCIIGPVVGSAQLSTGAGVALVSHTSWKIMPGMAASSTIAASGPLLAMMALPSGSWPVTTRWIAGSVIEKLLKKWMVVAENADC
jgi:hypothetical protein